MAESAVSEVVSRLAGLLSHEIILLYGVREEVEWMERELRWIKCFLKDADAKRRKGDARVKNWVSEVIQVAYQAEDAIDTFLVKTQPSQQLGRFRGHLNSCKPSSLIARHQVAVEIGKLKNRLNEIKTSREAYGIQNLGDSDTERLPAVRRHCSYESDDADVVCLFNDQKILLEQLMDHRNQQRRVVSIIGIGGLGKTTLARKLYRNNDVNRHFDICIWLTVSQVNSLIELLQIMLERVTAISKQESGRMREDDLIDKLKCSLERRRFLLVLDDVWKEEVWVRLHRAFPDVNNGSRILITTRFLNVAKQADPRNTPYQLRLLNDDESLELLLKKAFPHDQNVKASGCPRELLDVGRLLIRRCGGLPLALVVLGGLLSIKEATPAVWLKVSETMNWESEGRECQEILALSYHDLPYYMKSCFLYLAAYPEDHEISASRLIKLWIAEGFIPYEERKTMEDKGEAILEELVQRSLVRVIVRKHNGSIKRCGVHDLLLDFARTEAKKDDFLIVCSHENSNRSNFQKTARRVSVCDTDVDCSTMPSLRTAMVFEPCRSFLVLRSELLRVLDLIHASSKLILPKEIGRMIHLRYLGLWPYMAGDLPPSIGNLRSLETFTLSGDSCYTIPSTVWKIKTLRHVQVPLTAIPQNVELTELLSLGVILLKPLETMEWRFPNLRKLAVHLAEGHHEAALVHLLSGLHHLTSLDVRSATQIDTNDFPFHNRLQSLSISASWPKGDMYQYPACLTKLTLFCCGLKQDPMPKLERLQYLVRLTLGHRAYLGRKMVCSAGGFPRLQYLYTNGVMPNLEEWRIKRGAMPKLTYLHLDSCSTLKMFPDFQYLTSLQELKWLHISEKLRARVQEDTGEDWHKVQHIPKTEIFTTSTLAMISSIEKFRRQ